MSQPKLISGIYAKELALERIRNCKGILPANADFHVIMVSTNESGDLPLPVQVGRRSMEATFSEIWVNVKPVTLCRPTLDVFEKEIAKAAANPDVRAIIVLMPIPDELKPALRLIPYEKDIDALNPDNKTRICGVGEAVCQIVSHLRTDDDNVLVLGYRGFAGGNVVKGLDLRKIKWQGYDIKDGRDDEKFLEMLKNATIVISATSVPGLLNETNLSQGVLPKKLIVDVGFSYKTDPTSGEAVASGDVDRMVYKLDPALVRFITPVPGGCGPLSMAVHVMRFATPQLKDLPAEMTLESVIGDTVNKAAVYSS